MYQIHYDLCGGEFTPAGLFSAYVVKSMATAGVDGFMVEIEASTIKGQQQGMAIIGLPDQAIKEAGERIQTDQIIPKELADYAFIGELALDGRIRPCNGVLSEKVPVSMNKL